MQSVTRFYTKPIAGEIHGRNAKFQSPTLSRRNVGLV